MKVLLGIGGSEDSIQALERTVDRVERAGDDLTVAIVENPESELDDEAIAAKVEEVLEREGVEAPVRHVTGHAGSRIVEIAEDESFDQIVLGGGHQSPMGKIRIGHIAEFVLLNSRVTVTLIR